MKKIYVKVGDIVMMQLGYSEVLCHIKMAGKQANVKIISDYSAQLLREDGTPDGAPILIGEAGFYVDQDGYYYHSIEDQAAFEEAHRDEPKYLDFPPDGYFSNDEARYDAEQHDINLFNNYGQ